MRNKQDITMYHVGMKVVVHTENIPKQQLKESIAVSDDFRADFNAWLEKFFGSSSLEDGAVLINADQSIMAMNQKMYDQLSRAVVYGQGNPPELYTRERLHKSGHRIAGLLCSTYFKYN